MSEVAGAEVLLTGATGFLGKVVLHDLLARRESLGIERIHLLIRPSRRSEPYERFRSEIVASPCFAGAGEEWVRHVRVVPGDLARDTGLVVAADELSSRLSHVIHCAASVDFDLPLADALEANTRSALRMQELARGCTRLVSFVSVSTAYVTPHPGDAVPVEEALATLPRPAQELYAAILGGSVDERALLLETRHPNTYTLTKCLAEHLLVERRGDLPLTLIRPSIIAASWQRPFPGWIDSPAAFALFIMAVGTGKMRAVVGRPSARLDVVPCDEVSRRVIDAAFGPQVATVPVIRHAVAGRERGLALSVCQEGMESWFRRNPAPGTRDGAARVHYLGPPGLRYRFHHWRRHLRRRDARLVAPKMQEMNERFSYFTRHTFRFRSSVPFDAPGFTPRGYLEIVCRGVARHLLDADLRAVPLGGRDHPRMGRALGRNQRLVRELADVVSFDRLSFEEAVAGLHPLRGVSLAPARPDPDAHALLTHLVATHPDLWPGSVRIAAEPEADGLAVAIEREEGRIRLVCEARPDSRGSARRGSRGLLVTGASGFVGRHLLGALSETGHDTGRTLALVRDAGAWHGAKWTTAHAGVELALGSVTDPSSWQEALPPLGGIFHLAGVVRHSRSDTDEMLHTNIEGTLAMVRLAARHGCRLLVLSTSGTVGCYRDPDARADETAPWCDEEVARWPYYRSKQQAEQRARALAEELGVELVVIRPPVLLGPGDHRFRSSSNVLRALRRKLPFVVRGGMHFVDVRDAARALCNAMQRPQVRPVYHLDGTICGIDEFFAMIAALSGVPGPRWVLPYRPARLIAGACAGLGVHWVPDPVVVEMASHHWGTRSLYAADELAYTARPPEDTLRDTIDWLRENHDAFHEAEKRKGGRT